MKNLPVFPLKSTDYQFVCWKYFIIESRKLLQEMEQFQLQDSKYSRGKMHFVLKDREKNAKYNFPVDLRYTI